jgi:DNA-binding transcriptional LysR family regulator
MIFNGFFGKIGGMLKKLPLNLINLKYFCDAVKAGSVSASAKVNFVSQSAISQGIAKLEDLLQIKLVTHEPNRFNPTPEGLLLYEKSQKIFHTITEVEDALQGEEYQGQIQFACMHSFALAFLSKPISLLRKEYPGLHVNFHMANPDRIKKMLQEKAIDFGVVLDNEDFSSYECEVLYEGAYHLYATNEDAKSFILSERSPETNLLKKYYEDKYSKQMPVLMEVSSWEVISRLTEEGMGIGFFPDYIAKTKNLSKIDLGLPSIPYKILAIFPKLCPKSKNIGAFIQIFKKIHN